MAWNSGTAKVVIYTCGYCGKQIHGHAWRKIHFCSKECRWSAPNPTKGVKKNPDSIKKMVETRKAKGNYGWTDTQRSHLSQTLKGRPHSEEHKRKIGLAHKGKKLSQEFKAQLSQSKKGKVPNGEQHQRIIAEQIEFFRKDGYLCVRIDSRPHPDFIAIKSDRAYAVEVEGSHLNIAKYTESPHDYADVIWIRFRRDRNAG